MNRFTQCMVAGLFCSLLTSCCCISTKPHGDSNLASSPTKTYPKGAPSVSDIIKSVQAAIDSFYPQAKAQKNRLPPLKKVKLTLQTVLDSKTSVEADYLLVALKGYTDNALTQELDVILTPEQPKKARMTFDVTSFITKELEKAIKAAQNEIQSTYTGKTPGHSLNTDEVDVQISFVVTLNVSGGVNKWELLPISLSGSEEISYKTAHTITVVFANPSKSRTKRDDTRSPLTDEKKKSK